MKHNLFYGGLIFLSLACWFSGLNVAQACAIQGLILLVSALILANPWDAK